MSRKKSVPVPRPRTPPPAPATPPVDPAAADRWVREGALHESANSAEVEVVVAPSLRGSPATAHAVPSRPEPSRAVATARTTLGLSRGVQRTPTHDSRDYPRHDTAAVLVGAPAEDPLRDEPTPNTPRPTGRALVPRKSGRAQVKLTVYVDAGTSDALRAYCEKEGRQQSRVVDSALRAYLDAGPFLDR